MDKRLYIHIGIHKTGTSSLQAMCVRNREYLATKNIYYPTSCLWKGGHHNLAWEIIKDQRADEKYGNINALFQEINENTSEVYLISSEDFSRFSINHKEQLKQLFAQFEVKIIIYIRNQFDYIVSSWSTIIRENTSSAKFDAYYHFCLRKRKALLMYDLFLNEWANLFGKENLIVKTYKKQSGNNLHKEFLHLINNTISTKDLKLPERSNASLPVAELNLLRFLNETDLKLEGDSRLKFIEQLFETINQNYATRKKIVPPSKREGLRKRTNEHFKTSNKKVAQEYFNRNELFLNYAEAGLIKLTD